MQSQFGVPPQVPQGRYVPPPQVFRYRGGLIHLLSLALIVFPLLMWPSSSQLRQTNWVPVVVLSLVIVVGIWLQLRGWNEQIIIGPDGIRWIDCFGRLRVQASLDQIVRIEEKYDRKIRSMLIYTSAGTITGMSLMRDYDRLFGELVQVVQSRPPQYPGRTTPPP